MRASFGLTLANRGVIIGAVKASDLIRMAQQAEASGAFDAVWVGDSLLAKPRLESIALLSALAAVTSKIRLAVGCMATFVHRHPVLLAQQWASLDLISGGRSWLTVCMGGPNEQSAAQALEHAVMGVQAKERPARMVEGIEIIRKLFAEKNVSYHGRFYQFDNVTVEPHPVHEP
jgi:alkanesulfonate monooxygenase SsuD/methylene tetrahydromethanopterin reductase-like flavin-dependent oxidoreductase (luciferase family)